MEYLDINNNIQVYKLPLYENPPLIVKYINTLEGLQNIDLYKCINLIEFSLSEIIDLIVKKQLEKINTIKYNIVGGKGLNNIIRNKYLAKSFDFDIHVKNDIDVENISKYIVTECDKELNLHWQQMLRKIMYQKLLTLNMVDTTLENYYMNEHLIYYGVRNHRNGAGPNIKGLFLKLKLRNNLFEYKKKAIDYTNYYTNSLVDLNGNTDGKNILYIPIADIDTDAHLHFGIKVYDVQESIYQNPMEKVNYADYLILLFNLLNCVSKINGKTESNLNKYNKMIKPLYYNCNIYKYHDLNKFNELVAKINTQLQNHININIYNTSTDKFKQLIDNNKVSYINRTTTYGNIIETIINNILNMRDEILNRKCQITIGPSSAIRNSIFKDGINDINKKRLLSEFDNILYDLDKKDLNYYVLQYTGPIYRELNLYCNYINNKIDTTHIKSYTTSTFPIWVCNKTIILNNRTNTYSDTILKINNLYDDYHNDPRIINIKNNLKDSFYIYSLQTVTNLTQMDNLLNRSFIDLTYIKPGDIIEISQYISGTMDLQFNFSSFNNVPTNNIFYKIKINKNNNKWIIINEYSIVPSEAEILIKQGSIFIIQSIDYEVVHINSDVKEYKIITLELCDDTNMDILKKKILISNGFKPLDNVLKSSLFIETAKYVYEKHFKHAYKESNCKYLTAEPSMQINVIDVKGNSINKTIHKNNHSLAHSIRVACWIQLLYLHNKLYNDDNTIDHIFLIKTCIASLFMISGRESEADVNTKNIDQNDFERDCPGIDLNPYERYLKASANNFETYVTTIQDLNLFSQEEIFDYKYCLEYYYYIFTDTQAPSSAPALPNDINRKHKRKLYSEYFKIAHDIDLIRCTDRSILIPIPIETNNSQYQIMKTILSDLAINIIKNTGDRIFSGTLSYSDNTTTNREYSDYIPLEFYLCSTNIEYCIINVLNTSDLYFNNLIYNIENKNFLSNRNNKSFTLNGISNVTNQNQTNNGLNSYQTNTGLNSYQTNNGLNSYQTNNGLNSYQTNNGLNSYQTNNGLNSYQKLIGGSNINLFNYNDIDNDIDMNPIQIKINNNNIGSTFYLSDKTYNKYLSSYDIKYTSIYLQNIYMNFNKINDKNINMKIKYKKKIILQNEYKQMLAPKYFIIDAKIIKNDQILSPKYFIQNYQITKNPLLHDEQNDKILQNSLLNDKSNNLLLDNRLYQMKYLKYKNKYLQLKKSLK
jgi:hypothetical protein